MLLADIRETVAGITARFDRAYFLRQAGRDGTIDELWQELAAKDLLAVGVPESLGGVDGGLSGMATVMEEMSAVGVPPILYVLTAFSRESLIRHGSTRARPRTATSSIEKSGGFGTYLLMGVDWAPYPATVRSHQLFAEEVMPHFNGSLKPMKRSFEDVMGTGYSGAEITDTAQKAFTADYEASGGVRRKEPSGSGFIG